MPSKETLGTPGQFSMIANGRTVVRREVASTADLRAVRRLSFFLSPERISVPTAETSMGAAQITQRRLDRLQSVCGCIPATIALAIGVAFGLRLDAPIYAICAHGIGAAVVAKIVTVALAYFAYRIHLTRLSPYFGNKTFPLLRRRAP